MKHTSRPVLAADISHIDMVRFFRKVEIHNPDSCWLWCGAKGDGYGIFTIPKYDRLVGAHRISYALAHLECPADKFVLHRCDNPRCVNPSHLFLGTHQDNMIDRRDKKRDNKAVGERNGYSKLDVWDVVCIRADRRFQRVIARDYNISQTVVSNIKNRKLWAHVPELRT